MYLLIVTNFILLGCPYFVLVLCKKRYQPTNQATNQPTYISTSWDRLYYVRAVQKNNINISPSIYFMDLWFWLERVYTFYISTWIHKKERNKWFFFWSGKKIINILCVWIVCSHYFFLLIMDLTLDGICECVCGGYTHPFIGQNPKIEDDLTQQSFYN